MRAPRPRKSKVPRWMEYASFIIGFLIVTSFSLIFFISLPNAITELVEMFVNCFI